MRRCALLFDFEGNSHSGLGNEASEATKYPKVPSQTLKYARYIFSGCRGKTKSITEKQLFRNYSMASFNPLSKLKKKKKSFPHKL